MTRIESKYPRHPRHPRLNPVLLHCKPCPGIELLVIGRSDGVDPDRLLVTVPHRIAGDRQLGARLKVARFDAGAEERAGSFGFESPDDRLTVLLLDFNPEPRMRVGEFPLLDDALHGNGLARIEHRSG